MARTNRINLNYFLFCLLCNKNFLQVWEVAGHGVVTLPLPAVWGCFLSGKSADLPKECSSRKIREWGTKCSSTLLCLPGFGNTGLRLWQLSKVELEYVHSPTNSFSFLDQNYRNTALGALRSFFTVTFWRQKTSRLIL